MQLRFTRGDAQAPRGHAIVIARPYGQPDHALATYCIVLPIQFSLGRYLPPILASQLPPEGLRELAGNPSFMAVPPMLEEIDDIDALLDLADMRDDDVIEVEGDPRDEGRRMELAAESSAEYVRLYNSYTTTQRPSSRQRGPMGFHSQGTVSAEEALPVEPEHIETLLSDTPVISDREQLGEVAKLIGTRRYAMEGKDQHLLEETKRALRRAIAPLGEKYRTDALIDAALIPGERGQKLADLYLNRAFKLIDEDYPAIPPLEDQIRQLGGE